MGGGLINTPNINFTYGSKDTFTLNGGCKEPSVGNQLLRTGFGILGTAVTAAIAARVQGGDAQSEAQRAAAQKAEEERIANLPETKLSVAYAEAKADLDTATKELSDAESEIKRLSKEVDETTLATDKAMLKTLGDEIEANKTIADEIRKLQSTNTTLKSIADAKTNAYNTLNNEITNLENDKALYDSAAKAEDATPEEKNVAQKKSADCQAKIEKKQEELKNAQIEMEKANANFKKGLDDYNELLNNDAKQNIASKMEQYNVLDTKIKNKEANLDANNKELAELRKKLPSLQSNVKTKEDALKDIEDKQLKLKGQRNQEKTAHNNAVKKAGDKYTAADKADGNGWKRHMPKWLGGSNKADRLNMQRAHEQKKAAGEELEGLGANKSDYSNHSVNSANKKANELAKAYQKKYPNNRLSQQELTNYFLNHKGITIEDAYKALHT